MLGVLSLFFRRGFLQTELAGTRDILRDTEAVYQKSLLS